MAEAGTILSSIASRVWDIIPGVKVMLFGSRAYGTPTEESDWDILILTQNPVDAALKKEIHAALFPLSVQIGAFINTVIVGEYEWENSPSYYALRQTINAEILQA